MNINLLKSSSNNLLNIIVESTLVSNWISIISSKLCVCACVCVCERTVCGLCGHCCLCGCLASRKARWASAAVQSPVYLMRRPHAKLMWTSRSRGVHSEHAQISPRLQHTAANRTVPPDSVGLSVSSSRPDGAVDSIWFTLGSLYHQDLCFACVTFLFSLLLCIWNGIIMKEKGRCFLLNKEKIWLWCLVLVSNTLATNRTLPLGYGNSCVVVQRSNGVLFCGCLLASSACGP